MSLLQGTELYSTSIAPNNPNLQFDAQVTSGLQAQYNAGYERASVLYGSIMNPDLSRQDTQQAKEEYLKMVDQDLRRVGKMDWSIGQNVEAAENLFKGMWSNKLLLKDASWTKTYKEELNKAEGFKNCLDASKCGGQYWDEGVKYMNYKRQEFIGADSDSALGMDNTSYIPYNSVMDEAIKEMKASGLSMKTDSFSEDGSYIITTKNGEQLRSPLSMLFNKTIGKDPKFMEMFKVKSYVDRKDWIGSKLNSGEYANESEANLNYLNSINNRTIGILNKQAYDLGMDQEFLGQRLGSLQQQFENGEFVAGTEDHQKMLELQELKANTDNALNVVLQLKTVSQNKNKASLNVMVDSFDNENAFNYFNDEIQGAVNTLMMQDAEQSFAVDPYKMEQYKFGNDVKLKQMQYSHDVAMENIKQSDRMDLAKFNAENNPTDGEGDDAVKEMTFNQAVDKVTLANNNFEKDVKEAYLSTIPSEKKDAIRVKLEKGGLDYKDPLLKKFIENQRIKTNILKEAANKAALKADKNIEFPEVLKAGDLKFLNSESQLDDVYSKTVSLITDKAYGIEDREVINKAMLKPENKNKTLKVVIYDLLKK